MTEENKPLKSDVEEDEFSDDIFSQEDNQEENQSETGKEKDVDATEEFLAKVSSISGREFKTVEEYEKHYKNLSSFVGKKVESENQPQRSTPNRKLENDSLKEVLESNRKIEFFLDNPEAKKHFAEYVKPMADGSGISYVEAWEKVKPLIQSSEEQEKEKEIGVNSKSRIQTVDTSKLKSLAQDARSGNAAAQEALVAKMLGLEN